MIDRLESYRIRSVDLVPQEDGSGLLHVQIIDDATDCCEETPHVLNVQMRLDLSHLVLESEPLTRERADGVTEVYDHKTRLILDGHTKPLEGETLRKMWWE